jgi:uncharacterized membrane protein
MKKSLIIILSLLMPSIALGQYYADLELNINDDGTTIITGLTNHPTLTPRESSELTSKEGKYWLLNLSISDSFDYYVIKTVLPRGSIINYLKTPQIVQISEEGGRISITSIGNNESLNIIVQYSISREELNWLWLLLLIPAIIIPIYLRRPKKKRIDYSLLTKREAMIVKELSKKRLTQKELEDIIKIPKSSLSRNINSLIKKDLIVKKKKGMTNIIMLK